MKFVKLTAVLVLGLFSVPVPSMAQAQPLVATQRVCECRELSGNGEGNVTCRPSQLTLSFSLPAETPILACYHVYGDALTQKHDGAVAALEIRDGTGTLQQTAVATDLPPNALGGAGLARWPGNSALTACGIIDLPAGDWSVDVAVKYFASANVREVWGCSVQKFQIPSDLSLIRLP